LLVGWQCASTAPGRLSDPSQLGEPGLSWVPATVPGTVAGSLQASSGWTLDQPGAFDDLDWWFRTKVPVGVAGRGATRALRFGSLASLADVWVDGSHVLRSENMFLEHHVDLGDRPAGELDVVIRFASLSEALKRRRPRPRWRATIVTQQQLRWVRTTLLGRLPWTPAVPPVGPVGGVWLETLSGVRVMAAEITPRVEGSAGLCEIELRLDGSGRSIRSVSAWVGGESAPLACTPEDGVVLAKGTVQVRDVARWWPFTHGRPALYPVRARIDFDGGTTELDLGETGFRSIEVDVRDEGFGLRINGVDVFCRGACWTPLDFVSLQNDGSRLRASLEAVRDAGMNMLRLSGAMIYGPQTFHDLCDELGIMVWQDFMFANMDYPFDDEMFAASVRAEVAQTVSRLQTSPSLAVLCGNSEIQQQVAMLGMPPATWASAFFDEELPSTARRSCPGVPYVPSSPTGGALPFHVNKGIAHYYGVGGYRRPLADARRAGVRFTSECLGFANVPCDETIEGFMGDLVPTGHPRWKERVPRDHGTAWDFDDVRDHYVGELFAVDPVGLRMTDPARYLELGRVATGEAMAAAMAEWRRAGSSCRGALVWFLRDFWPGAGWGVVDSTGRPKAAYYFLRRVLQPIALLAVDEGLNGLGLHVVNDGPEPFEGHLDVVLYRRGETPVSDGSASVSVPAHGAVGLSGDAVLGRFTDLTYAYRFGSPGHDLVVATLRRTRDAEPVARAFFPSPRSPVPRRADLGVEAWAERLGPEQWRVHVRSAKFARAVAFDARGLVAEDEFFDVEPGGERSVLLRGSGSMTSARVVPLNADAPTKITLRP
jgi:beta-mannosidase